MKKPYGIFIGLIKKAYEDIEERLEPAYTEGDTSGLTLEEELAIMQICK